MAPRLVGSHDPSRIILGSLVGFSDFSFSFLEPEQCPKTTYNIPRGSMELVLFPYIWMIFMVNVGKYAIHGSFGIHDTNNLQLKTIRMWQRNVAVLQVSVKAFFLVSGYLDVPGS